MRVRHRIPSIFNLSMVDVMCCALGCVILLWLLNLREAKQHQEEAEEANKKNAAALVELNDQIESLTKDRAAVRKTAAEQASSLQELDEKLKQAMSRAATLDARLIEAMNRAASLEGDLTASRKEAGGQKDRADDFARKIAALNERVTDLTAKGSVEKDRGDDLARKLAAAGVRIKDLQATADLIPDLRSQLKAAQTQYTDSDARAKDLEKDAAERKKAFDILTKHVETLEKDRASLEKDVADRNNELKLFRPYKDKWADDEEKISTLKKERDDARGAIESLQADNKKWQAETTRVRTEAERRFAGISPTGTRVVFLIDKSGSMEYLDDDTPAPQKWVEVRNTVAKLMRSLPDLEKFQVIVFSDKQKFLLGGDDAWLDFDAKTSPDKVVEALAAIKPSGGTDMYAPMEAAFRYRARGLDAVYLLSDGLPNLGEGLKADPGKLTEVERGSLLGAHIRKKLKTDWNQPLAGKARVRINSLGFFYESPDVGAFLWALSRENDGGFVGMSKP